MGNQALAVESATEPVRLSSEIGIQIYADGADLESMVAAYERGLADGFTTNPTLMAQAGVPDYRTFAMEALAAVSDVPISFEVFADEFEEMGAQAREISSWGDNVYVKIPVSNTHGDSSVGLVQELSADGLKLNVTAVLTLDQVREMAAALNPDVPAIISIFAGRIADTGVDPCPAMQEAVEICKPNPNIKVLWASPREVLNVYQARDCGCHLIALTPSLIKKLPLRNKDLAEFSRETVQMFYDDAARAGYRL